MRAEAHQKVIAGGLTPAQAAMFSEAVSTAHLGRTIEMMEGSTRGGIHTLIGMLDRFGPGDEEGARMNQILEAAGYRETLRDEHFDAIKAVYMQHFNGNKQKATEYANATFDAIAEAGTAGANNGMNYLGHLSMLNAALGDAPDRR